MQRLLDNIASHMLAGTRAPIGTVGALIEGATAVLRAGPRTAREARRWSPQEVASAKLRRFRLAAIVASVLLLVGCAPAPDQVCMPGEQPLVNELLYFGLAKPDGVVTPEEWSEFLQSSVTPRFPDGLTVWQASGQWKSGDGSITRESSYVLNLLHAGAEPADAAVRALVSEYKMRFRQEAVLRVRGHACISL